MQKIIIIAYNQHVYKPPLASQHTKWVEVKETAGNPTGSKFPRQMEALCRKRWWFQLKTIGPHHKRELKGGFVLKPLDRKGLLTSVAHFLAWISPTTMTFCCFLCCSSFLTNCLDFACVFGRHYLWFLCAEWGIFVLMGVTLYLYFALSVLV